MSPTPAMHLDGATVAKAIDTAVAAGPSGTGTGAATHVANAAATGVTNPANAAYTLADQTALAAAVQNNTTKINAIIAALIAAGLMKAT